MAAPSRGTGAVGLRRSGKPAAARGALLALLLTCCVRCAARAKPSNIVLVLVDDQDVDLGGMVSGAPGEPVLILQSPQLLLKGSSLTSLSLKYPLTLRGSVLLHLF